MKEKLSLSVDMKLEVWDQVISESPWKIPHALLRNLSKGFVAMLHVAVKRNFLNVTIF